MKSALLFLILSCLSIKVTSQNFKVRADIGRLTELVLKKNHTYKYLESNINYDWTRTIDSGSYNIEKGIITFISNTETKFFSDNKYFIKKINLKSYEWFYTPSMYSEKKTLKGYQITFLSKTENITHEIYSKKPKDNVVINSINSNQDKETWILNEFLSDQFKKDEIIDATRDTLFLSKNLLVIAVHNRWGDLFDVFYFTKDKVYRTKNSRLPEYQNAVITKCYKEKLINSNEKKILEKEVNSFLIGNIKTN